MTFIRQLLSQKSHSQKSAIFGVTRDMQTKMRNKLECYVNLDGVETFSDT